VNIDSARRLLGETSMWVGSIVMLSALLLVGTQSTVLAIAALGLAGGLALIACLGLAKAGTFLVTIAMFLAPLNNLRLGASYVTVSDVVFVLGFMVLTPTILRNKIQIPSMFIFGLGVLLTMGAIASAAAPIPIVSVSQLFRLMVGAFLLPIFFMVWRPPTPVIVRFAAAYMLGTVFSVGYGLVQGPVAGDARYIGYTYHPNYLGLSCLLAASLAPYVTAKIQPQYRWIFWFAALISAYGVWISGSRAALIVLIMLVVVYPFVERSILAVWSVGLAFTGALAFSGKLLQEDGNSALGRLFGSGTATGSDEDRKRILSAAWKQFTQHPILGNGFDGGIGSHNIYLQVAVAVGIFGLIGYLCIIWSALRPIFWAGTGHRLAYPVLAYAAIGPLTNTLWERMIWAVLALSFIGDAKPPGQADSEDVSDDALVKEGT
jgi:O-antigen ligase